MSEALVLARRSLAVHGKSFRFAGALLSRADLDDAAVVYAFCRAADDAVDEAASVDDGRAGLAALRAELGGERAPRPLVAAFHEVCARRGIDRRYADELLTGMADDAHDSVVVEDDAALLRYCYRAAGVVGGLMAPLLGARDGRALPFAVDLGIAMQLTNICRDVKEDALRGRVYLPRTRLLRAGGRGDVAALVAPVDVRDRDAVVVVVGDLLRLADRYYDSGARGFAFLAPRPRTAIAVAARIYRAIGTKLLRRGGDPLQGRVSTTIFEKVGLALAALPAALRPRAEHHDASLHGPLRGLPGTAELA